MFTLVDKTSQQTWNQDAGRLCGTATKEVWYPQTASVQQDIEQCSQQLQLLSTSAYVICIIAYIRSSMNFDKKDLLMLLSLKTQLCNTANPPP